MKIKAHRILFMQTKRHQLNGYHFRMAPKRAWWFYFAARDEQTRYLWWNNVATSAAISFILIELMPLVDLNSTLLLLAVERIEWHEIEFFRPLKKVNLLARRQHHLSWFVLPARFQSKIVLPFARQRPLARLPREPRHWNWLWWQSCCLLWLWLWLFIWASQNATCLIVFSWKTNMKLPFVCVAYLRSKSATTC